MADECRQRRGRRANKLAVDGKQYIAVLAGRSESPPAFMGEVGKRIIAATPEGGTLFVFGL